MSLKAILPEVPEGLEDHYVAGTGANEGKFILSVESVDGFGLEDVGGLKRTLEEVKGKATSRKERLTGFGEYTPDSIKELEIKAQSAGKPSEALESLKNEMGQKLTASQSTIEQLEKQIKEGNQRNTINSIFASNASKFQEGSADFAKQVLSKYIGTDAEGNAFVWNQDKTGARMSSKQGAWEKQMSPGEWLEGVTGAVMSKGSFDGISSNDLASFGFMLSSNAKSGSGQGSPNAPSAGMSPEKWAGMNLDARTKYAKENGMPKF